jgi:hypothetical protein
MLRRRPGEAASISITPPVFLEQAPGADVARLTRGIEEVATRGSDGMLAGGLPISSLYTPDGQLIPALRLVYEAALTIPLPEGVPRTSLQAMQAIGNCCSNIGITSGAWLLAAAGATPENGQVVAATFRDGNGLKRQIGVLQESGPCIQVLPTNQGAHPSGFIHRDRVQDLIPVVWASGIGPITETHLQLARQCIRAQQHATRKVKRRR